jgi:GNAT superfamily N-acetyltransferase
MNIRQAKNSDSEIVTQMVSDLMIELGFPEFDGGNLDKIFKGMVDGGKYGFVMLAEGDDAICGICTVSFVASLRTRGVYGIVQEMYVLPGLRGNKIGAEMLITALEYAQSVGCIMVEVGTPPEGSRQSRFYKGVGFQRFGDRYRYKFDK